MKAIAMDDIVHEAQSWRTDFAHVFMKSWITSAVGIALLALTILLDKSISGWACKSEGAGQLICSPLYNYLIASGLAFNFSLALIGFPFVIFAASRFISDAISNSVSSNLVSIPSVPTLLLAQIDKNLISDVQLAKIIATGVGAYGGKTRSATVEFGHFLTTLLHKYQKQGGISYRTSQTSQLQIQESAIFPNMFDFHDSMSYHLESEAGTIVPVTAQSSLLMFESELQTMLDNWQFQVNLDEYSYDFRQHVSQINKEELLNGQSIKVGDGLIQLKGQQIFLTLDKPVQTTTDKPMFSRVEQGVMAKSDDSYYQIVLAPTKGLSLSVSVPKNYEIAEYLYLPDMLYNPASTKSYHNDQQFLSVHQGWVMPGVVGIVRWRKRAIA